MNTIETDIRDLLDNDTGVRDRLKEWINAQMKHCCRSFVQYENSMTTSMHLINDLYESDVTMELLLACTQMGKTSTVFWTAYNLMTHMDDRYFVPYPFVFIITGLNSNSWKEQTKERVLPSMRENVWHNKDMLKRDNVQRLKDAVMSEYNTLIVIDEVHVGTKLDHVIFNTLREFHPENDDRVVSHNEMFEFLHLQKVKFILVSATPDAIKETMEHNWDSKRFRTVMAKPDSVPGYVWHKHFLNRGRVHQVYGMKDRDENGVRFHRAIARRISEYKDPKYHMIRFPMDSKNADIETCKDLLTRSIRKLDVVADVVLWDSKNSIQKHFYDKKYKVFLNEEIKESKMTNMTNEMILKEKPRKHTIFILKEFFRVAQTMPIDNIGVLVDRDTKSPCDSTLSQSLIGRACGHNKEQFIDQILIYTNVQSVVNYINLWENGFDYAKVPEYVGTDIRTNKNSTKLIAKQTMLGSKVERAVEWNETLDGEDEIDTNERLEKVRRVYMKRNQLVHQIINRFVENDLHPLTANELDMCSRTGKLHVVNYSKWNDEHNQFKIIERTDTGMWSLRDVIKRYLNLS
jgi:hypothetical protein